MTLPVVMQGNPQPAALQHDSSKKLSLEEKNLLWRGQRHPLGLERTSRRWGKLCTAKQLRKIKGMFYASPNIEAKNPQGLKAFCAEILKRKPEAKAL